MLGGGGVVGVELAQAYASFGAVVTLIERGPAYSREEPFAGAEICAALREHGDALGLDTVGLEPGAHLPVDTMRVEGHDWLYAIGDVNSRSLLTHMGKYQARVASLAIECAEWLQAATTAIVGEVPLARLWDCVPAFPTRSEVWLRLLEDWERSDCQGRVRDLATAAARSGMTLADVPG